MNNFKNEKGLTLVELLVVLVLGTVIIIMGTSLVVKAIENNRFISQETIIRDEADYLMSSIVREIYTLPDSKIKGLEKSAYTVDGNSYEETYLVYEHNAAETFTGFKYNSTKNELELFVRGNSLLIQNSKIKINQSSKIEKSFSYNKDPASTEKHNNNVYKVVLKLTYQSRETVKDIEFVNEITTIKDE